MSISTHALRLAASVIPRRANDVKDLPTLEVEAVSDDDIAEEQRGQPGFGMHR